MTIETVPKRTTGTLQVFIGPCFVKNNRHAIYILAGEAPTPVGALSDAISELEEIIKKLKEARETERKNAIRR